MGNQRERAYQEIRDAIMYGDLKPGEQLFESKICKMFHVGRTPFREAIRQLQMEGFIDVLPNKGAIVSKISIADIDEIYNIVALLESYATEVSTQIFKPSDRKRLLALQNSLRKAAVIKNYQEWMEKNTLFHGYFPLMSGNSHLSTVIDGLRRRIYRYRFMSITIPGHLEEYLSDHEEILSAISQEEAKKAGDAMRKHVLNVKQILIDFLQHFPAV